MNDKETYFCMTIENENGTKKVRNCHCHYKYHTINFSNRNKYEKQAIVIIIVFITSCLCSSIRDVVACRSGLGMIRRIDPSKQERNQSKNELSRIDSLKTTKSNKQKDI